MIKFIVREDDYFTEEVGSVSMMHKYLRVCGCGYCATLMTIQ